jgi:N-methylhydantoinase A
MSVERFKLLGVDVGGTFVDIVVVDKEGNVLATKVPTTDDLFNTLIAGLDQLGTELEELDFIVHGTTVGTNVLVEKKGARTLLIMTKGFRDILEIRRTNKGELFDLNWSPPRPIIERVNRLEIEERVSWTGEELLPLDTSDIDRIGRIIEKRDIQSIAISFLHSYIAPKHEQQLKRLLKEKYPDIHISISSDIVPSYREFERTSTTAANAYISPVVSSYIDRLNDDFRSHGVEREFHIMQSNGGISALSATKEIPAKTVQSGPAGGTVGVAALARRTGIENLIGLDIGGTTADVSIVWKGEPQRTEVLNVEFGLPIMFPAIDIVSIGAGGGTVAWIDAGGALRMGPESAGANPGPACYGYGGESPTSTDAQLLLGRLNPQNFLGGRMSIYPELSRKAIEEHVSGPLALSLHDAAEGMVKVLTNNMIQAIRLMTIERGYDTRDFALCAFGGGGALYGAEIARELMIPTVVVPAKPGVFAAYGMLGADLIQDANQTVLSNIIDIDPEEVEKIFSKLQDKVKDLLGAEVPVDEITITRYADLLYSGQTHTIPISISSDTFSEQIRLDMVSEFHQEHMRRFGHSDPALPIEFVNLRVFGNFVPTRPTYRLDPERLTERTASDAPIAQRDVFFGGEGFVRAEIFDRAGLSSGSEISGPAIVEQMDTTTVIPPGMHARVSGDEGDLIIEINGL